MQGQKSFLSFEKNEKYPVFVVVVVVFCRFITKTCLYNFDPLKPHFYIVKLGFTGVYIIFEAVLTSTHNLCFKQTYVKYQNFLSEKFHFLVVKFPLYLNRHVFLMFQFMFVLTSQFYRQLENTFQSIIYNK